MGARHTAPIVEVFKERFKNTFKTLAEGGRTPALWAQYHYMVDVITIFIRSERLAAYGMSCIVTRMLDIFSASGYHQYAKGERLYCQLMKQLENVPSYKDALESFTTHGNRVFRYSCHEWSGTSCDICIEQTLMKVANPTEVWVEEGWEIVILAISVGCRPSTTSPMSTTSCR